MSEEQPQLWRKKAFSSWKHLKVPRNLDAFNRPSKQELDRLKPSMSVRQKLGLSCERYREHLKCGQAIDGVLKNISEWEQLTVLRNQLSQKAAYKNYRIAKEEANDRNKRYDPRFMKKKESYPLNNPEKSQILGEGRRPERKTVELPLIAKVTREQQKKKERLKSEAEEEKEEVVGERGGGWLRRAASISQDEA